MSEVRKWLGAIGLTQYADAFDANDIDLDLLTQIDDQMLKDIGVSSAGHRLRIRNAIAKLKPTAVVEANTSGAVAAPEEPTPSAERRQLTVMFCDLVGSTALSGKLDPEDLRGIVGSYHRCCTELIERNGGFVAKYMGDGVLAYFGYPQAHEHDAERAVRAGLALVEAVPKLETAIAGTSLQVRVGIATGLVVVGDLVGSGEAQERGIIGETPNLAARLQALAEPNTVVIAEGTRRLLGNLFELADLGAKDLKGIAGPSRVWAALRASSAESRFEALHATGLIALVGREEETELLLRRWSRAKTSNGQVVLLSGEAGIGKSRLTAALLECLASEPHTRLRYFCAPQHTDSALHPIIGQMERAAGLAQDDKPQAKLDKLDAVLAQTSTSIEDAALFAEMLSLPNDGRYPALDLTPQKRRQRTLEALISQLEALARQSPVLMIFEDAHWIDPTSLELFGRVVDRIATLHVLLIVTFRPEFDPPWIGQPHVMAMTINRLTQPEAGAMIDAVVGNVLHRLLGISLLVTGNIAESRSYYDHAIALYDPVAHRPLATRFGQDILVATLSYRSLALWLLGYPEAARMESERAIKDAREIGQAATLMHVPCHAALTNILRGDYAAAAAQGEELAALAEEKVSSYWKAHGMMQDGCAMVLAGKASKAARIVASGITECRSTGATAWMPWYLSFLARAHANLGQLVDAWHFIAEALTVMETTKETWCEAEVRRVAGDIARKSPEPETAKAEDYFERALAVARAQQAKSWELRASMSMARLWRDQGKRQQAHDLLAPVYAWFSEGFDTLDLKQTKGLLDELG